MRITAEISLYPLNEQFVSDITDFILVLRRQPGIEIISNQMSTQLRGDFAAVTGALNRCMEASMAGPGAMAFVVKYLNADLPIGSAPGIDGAGH
ncbi:MAG: hypothetical protein KJ054_02710 [Gammaproteobacteria bacterium]|nr:hypothetical protein [Gammaproteobacteria bacterium]